jgi:hypothetical protein
VGDVISLRLRPNLTPAPIVNLQNGSIRHQLFVKREASARMRCNQPYETASLDRRLCKQDELQSCSCGQISILIDAMRFLMPLSGPSLLRFFPILSKPGSGCS